MKIPRLLLANIMHNADRALKMSEGRDILVVSAWCAIIDEAQSLPLPEMHVQETLICPVKANSSLRECKKRVVVPHVRTEDHDASIKAVGPSYVGHCSKAGVKCEELIGASKSYSVCVKVYDLSVLSLSPEFNL